MTPKDSSNPILLDSYAARSCPVKTRNRFDRTVTLPVSSTHDSTIRAATEATQELFTGSHGFKTRIMDILATGAGVADLRSFEDSHSEEHQSATEKAIRNRAPLILAPSLPQDLIGHRTGSPDALILGPNTAKSTPGYHPMLIKRHQMLEEKPRQRRQPCTPIVSAAKPDRIGDNHPSRTSHLVRIPGCGIRTSREPDLLQLAHFYRLLQAAGWASDGPPLAGIIGTDELIFTDAIPQLATISSRHHKPATDKLVISWANLRAKRLRTFARSAEAGWRFRCALDRYDHEFEFRLRIAEAARKRTGSANDPKPIAEPIVIRECETCHWWLACKPQLNDDDLSLRIEKARLDAHEIIVLRWLGISTINDLADTNIEELLAVYLPEVQHRPGAERRLRLAAKRARMIADGIEIEKTKKGPLKLPKTGFSIDFDIETSATSRVYLWGFLVNDPSNESGSYYVHFSRFEDLDARGERELAEQAAAWLVEQLTAHPQARVYHYSDYEVLHIRNLSRRNAPHLKKLYQNWVRSNFFDLFSVVRSNFFGVHGLGLKTMAHDGAGFSWRDDEPGGLNSQFWFAEAVHSPDPRIREEYRNRVLAYNEDDVRATLALRHWMRTLS